MKYSVILFHSTNYAIWAADALKQENIKNKMISVPRHLSSDCGYCVRIKTEDKVKAETVLSRDKIDFEKIESI